MISFFAFSLRAPCSLVALVWLSAGYLERCHSTLLPRCSTSGLVTDSGGVCWNRPELGHRGLVLKRVTIGL